MYAQLALLALSAASPQQKLQKVDEAINRWTDQFFVYEMVDRQPGKNPRKLGLTVHMKGEKRLTEFTDPPEMKGMRILILSPTRMYIYLPAYKKVRRVASHVSAQGLMGTAFASDDLAVETYADKYTAKLKSETKDEFVLHLVAKDGADAPYPQITMTVEKKRFLPKKFVYSDKKGSLLKTERRGAYRCDGNICIPSKVQMEDHRRPGHVTQLLNKKWKTNSGLSDSLFTKRTLLKGR